MAGVGLGIFGSIAGFVGGLVAGHFLKDKFNFSSLGGNSAPVPKQLVPAPG